MCVCAWNFFVLLVAWLVLQCLMLFYFMLLRRCFHMTTEKWNLLLLSVGFLVAVISAYFKSVCLVYNSFLLLSNWCLVFFQRSFTLILEAWDWDNDTKAGEYLCKAWICTCSVLYLCILGRGEIVSCCNQPSLQISSRQSCCLRKGHVQIQTVSIGSGTVKSYCCIGKRMDSCNRRV